MSRPRPARPVSRPRPADQDLVAALAPYLDPKGIAVLTETLATRPVTPAPAAR